MRIVDTAAWQRSRQIGSTCNAVLGEALHLASANVELQWKQGVLLRSGPQRQDSSVQTLQKRLGVSSVPVYQTPLCREDYECRSTALKCSRSTCRTEVVVQCTATSQASQQQQLVHITKVIVTCSTKWTQHVCLRQRAEQHCSLLILLQ